MQNNNLILANVSNGLAFPHHSLCYFQSNHGHNGQMYFRHDAMPLDAIKHLLLGGTVTIVDGTRRHKLLSDGLKWGCGTFCLVFNRAIGTKKARNTQVAPWQTDHMVKVANSAVHKPMVATIRKLIKYYGHTRPAVIGKNINLVCHQGFIADDKPKRIRELLTDNAIVNRKETVGGDNYATELYY